MNAHVIHTRNPFNPWRDRDVYPVEAPIVIAAWIEQRAIVFDRPTICIVNGEAVLRAEWPVRTIADGDVVAFVALPQGGGDGSNPLAIVAMIAVSVFAPGIGQAIATAAGIEAPLGIALVKGAVAFAGMALVNALIPPPKPAGPQTMRELAAPSPTYSLQAQGNQARLGSAIPAIYGTHLVYPDFAARPYAEFVANEQYLYQLFVIGQGYYTVGSIRIEDTPIASFENVTYEIVAPGGNVTLFPTNVVSAAEVVGQDCVTGVTLGPFVANASGTTANYIAIDVVMPRGLFYAEDNGSLTAKSISWTVEAQPINSGGTPTGAWSTLGSETYTAASNTAQRASYRYGVTAGRYQVRLTRTDTKDTSSRAGHDLAWFGLRAYLTGGQAYGNVTLLAVRMQASNQLSGVSSRKINVTVTRKLPIWTGSGWTAPAETQSIAWALADMCRADYGGQLADSRIDLEQLLALDTVWAARGDKFNAVIDARVGFWDALSACARAGRAVPILQGGVIHFVRDALQTLPVALFTMRNIVRGSLRIEYVLHTDQTTDAAEAEYFDEATWSPKSVLAVLPSGTDDRPAKLRGLVGVTSRAQAWREAMYAAAQNRYRRKIVTFQTELEGFIPTFGDLIAIAHDMPAWGQSAEMVEYSDGNNLLTYSDAFGSWSGAAAVTDGGLAPNGRPGADTLTDADGVAWQSRLSNGVAVVPGSTLCMSIFVKRDATPRTTRYPTFRLLTNVLNTLVDASIDTSTGECAITNQSGAGWSNVTLTCEVVDEDWFRLVLRATAGVAGLTTAYCQIFPSVGYGASLGSYYANAQGSITVWGAQLEVGANLLTYSSEFGSWGGDATVTDGGTGPGGQPGADTLTDASASVWRWRNSNTVAAEPGSSWRMSIYVKKDSTPGTTRWPMFRLLTNVSLTQVDVSIDTSTGECAVTGQGGTGWSGVSATCVAADADWWHLVCRATNANPALTLFRMDIFPSVGSGASLAAATYSSATQGAVTVWGAQLVRDLGAGEYVPTQSSSRSGAKYARLSELLTWADSGAHYLAVRKRDGGVDGPHGVQCGASPDVVVFDTAPSFAPNTTYDEERAHVAFGLGDGYRLRAIVTAVRARGDLVEIAAVNEDDTVHTVDGGSPPAEGSWSLPAIPTVPQIPYDGANPNSYLSVVAGGTAENPTLTLSWSAAAGADRYYVEQSFDGTHWTRVGETAQTRFSFTTVPGSQYVRVAPVGATIGDWVVWSGSVTGAPQVVVPSDPLTVVATAAGLAIIVDWVNPAQANIEFAEILRNTVNNSATAGIVGTVGGTITTFVDTLSDSGLTRYYWVRLVNTKGVKSAAVGGVSATTTAIGGIEVLSSLPTTDLTEGRVVYLTTNKKIYRYDGSAWTAAADGADLLANTVTANKLSVANLAAISANLGAITAGSLNINSRFVVDSAGNVTISNAASGARLEVRNDVIKVYDSGGVLRVKLGNLSA